MRSASKAVRGRKADDQGELPFEREAEGLVSEHGDAADFIAAHRADALFGSGDRLGGTRWLKIFRRIALAHRRGTQGN